MTRKSEGHRWYIFSLNYFLVIVHRSPPIPVIQPLTHPRISLHCGQVAAGSTIVIIFTFILYK